MWSYLINLILLFFIYGLLGFIVEIIYVKFAINKWVNRGFLIGPICPIYGGGAILLLLFLKKYENDFLALFLGSIFICSILEYFTSYLLEKIFKARWWDYSHLKYNINGRICLETMLPFGIGGVVIVGLVNPLLVLVLNKIPFICRLIISIILLIVFIVDVITSFTVIYGIKGKIKYLDGDNTDEIKDKVKQIFLNNSYIYRRLIKAFPNLFIKTINLNKLESLRLKRKQKNKLHNK